MPFQTQVQITQAIGVPGDFASRNHRHSALSAAGGFTAGPSGLTIGLFAWADSATGLILSNTGTGAPTCFVHRTLGPVMITVYLSEYGMTYPAGQAVGEMFTGGDFLVKNFGAGAVTIGMKAFANNANGTASFAAAGSTVAGSTETKFSAQTMGAANEVIKISNTPLG